jgi:hypothetical protein
MQWGDKVREASAHDGPWPRVAIWHGETDRTVSPANAISVAAQWADVHGASEAPDAQEKIGRRTRAIWTHKGETIIELNLLSGTGHGAMVKSQGEGACGEAGPYLLECDVAAAAATVAFWGLDRVKEPVDTKPQPIKSAPKPHSTPAHLAAPAEPPPKPKGFDLGRMLKGAISALRGNGR